MSPLSKERFFRDHLNRPCVAHSKTQKIQIDCPFDAEYTYTPGQGQNLVILLHGFAHNADFMMNFFQSAIQDSFRYDHHLLSINAPFVVTNKDHKKKFQLSYAWYFYDSQQEHYVITQDFACNYIKKLVQALNLDHLNKILIGYSQGGYLAPFASLHLEKVSQVIGLACNFKSQYLPKQLDFYLDAIHGEDDVIVDYHQAKKEHQIMKEQGNQGDFISLKNNHHRLTEDFVRSTIEIMKKRIS